MHWYSQISLDSISPAKLQNFRSHLTYFGPEGASGRSVQDAHTGPAVTAVAMKEFSDLLAALEQLNDY